MSLEQIREGIAQARRDLWWFIERDTGSGWGLDDTDTEEIATRAMNIQDKVLAPLLDILKEAENSPDVQTETATIRAALEHAIATCDVVGDDNLAEIVEGSRAGLAALDRLAARLEADQRKVDAYDAARATVKTEGNTRAFYVLRAVAAEAALGAARERISVLEAEAERRRSVSNAHELYVDMIEQRDSWKDRHHAIEAELRAAREALRDAGSVCETLPGKLQAGNTEGALTEIEWLTARLAGGEDLPDDQPPAEVRPLQEKISGDRIERWSMRRRLDHAQALLGEYERQLREIADNAEGWHGPPPDMGHVRALAVIATTARGFLAGGDNAADICRDPIGGAPCGVCGQGAPCEYEAKDGGRRYPASSGEGT